MHASAAEHPELFWAIRGGGGPQAPVDIHVAVDGDDPEAAALAIDPIRRLGTVIDDDVAPRSPFIAVRSVGGAVSRVPGEATAYAHRQAELMFVTTVVGPRPAIDAAAPGLAAIWARLAPHVSGAYANFLATATDEDVAAIYPAPTYQRLAAVKRAYDPGNLFASDHNIRPQ